MPSAGDSRDRVVVEQLVPHATDRRGLLRGCWYAIVTVAAVSGLTSSCDDSGPGIIFSDG